jgi:hypothetical protein
MRVKDLPPIFAKCRSEEDSRYSISKSWIDASGQYVCSTDGRIVVRMPVPPDGIEGDLGTKPPPIDGLGWDGPFEDLAAPIPELTEDSREVCYCCHGMGQHNCGAECQECDGMGYYVTRGATVVGNVTLGNEYIRKIVAANASIFVRKDGKDNKPVRFVGPDFEGLLMPRTA